MENAVNPPRANIYLVNRQHLQRDRACPAGRNRNRIATVAAAVAAVVLAVEVAITATTKLTLR